MGSRLLGVERRNSRRRWIRLRCNGNWISSRTLTGPAFTFSRWERRFGPEREAQATGNDGKRRRGRDDHETPFAITAGRCVGGDLIGREIASGGLFGAAFRPRLVHGQIAVRNEWHATQELQCTIRPGTARGLLLVNARRSQVDLAGFQSGHHLNHRLIALGRMFGHHPLEDQLEFFRHGAERLASRGIGCSRWANSRAIIVSPSYSGLLRCRPDRMHR